ncbi:MAG: single-stranded-DNA-specific exonuclease RecJ [Alphaproteobacteria bacterium]
MNNNKLKPSILDKNYLAKDFDDRLSKTIAQRFNISPIIADLLAMRGIAIDEVEEFLEPKIKNSLPDPFSLGGVSDGVERVLKAINQQQKITIFADYDVDGATSCALLVRFFREIGVEAEIYVPDRILEGYGPNSQALLNLKKNGSDLVITVDCGTVAFKPLEDAKKAGLEVIVIDHHLGVVEKPEAIAIINPNLLDEKFAIKNICGCAVSFLFIVAVNKMLRQNGFYKDKKEPNLFELLDLVALGTVCDVMPLTGLNRAFVSAGLKILKQRKNLGLRRIIDLAGLNTQPDAYSLGFVLGPRINASGRIGKADLGATILSSECEIVTQDIALQLEEFNKQRKDIEAKVLEQAVARLENGVDGFSKNDPIIFALGDDWHQGVIGIIASRLKDLYNKPVAVLSLDKKIGKAKASCRSITGIDFGANILQARLAGLLLEGGGHAMAGGFSVKLEKIAELHQFFCQKLQDKVAELSAQNLVYFDLEIDIAQLNLELLKELLKLEPYGVGNMKPRFLIKDAKKIRSSLIGSKQEHISCIFSAKSLLGFDNQINAVAFRSNNTKLGDLLLSAKTSQSLNLIATLNINNWMGVEKVQMMIEDIIL